MSTSASVLKGFVRDWCHQFQTQFDKLLAEQLEKVTEELEDKERTILLLKVERDHRNLALEEEIQSLKIALAQSKTEVIALKAQLKEERDEKQFLLETVGVVRKAVGVSAEDDEDVFQAEVDQAAKARGSSSGSCVDPPPPPAASRVPSFKPRLARGSSGSSVDPVPIDRRIPKFRFVENGNRKMKKETG